MTTDSASVPFVRTPSNNFQGLCYPEIYIVYFSFNITGLAVNLTWTPNSTVSYWFAYGKSSPVTGFVSANGKVPITGLVPSTLYYFSVKASSNIASCSSVKHVSWYNSSFMSGCGVTCTGSGAGCPVASVISVLNVTTTTISGQLVVGWRNSLSKWEPVFSYTTTITLYLNGVQTNRITNPNSNPYQFTGLGANEYIVTIQASALGNFSACVAPSFYAEQVWSGCQETGLHGFVYWGVSAVPLYGATVVINYTAGPSWHTTTGASGQYYWSPGCAAVTGVTVSVAALGFTQTVSSQRSLGQHQFAYQNVSLIQTAVDVPTDYQMAGISSVPREYNLDQLAGRTSGALPTAVTTGPLAKQNVTGLTASWFQTSSMTSPSTPPSPFNPDGKVLQVTGLDSSGTNDLALGAFQLPAPSPFGVTGNLPSLSVPLSLQFDIFVPTSSFMSHFSVDALLSNGQLISNTTDNVGNTIHDGRGLPCSASQLTFPTNRWIPEACDVSALGDLNISAFYFEYVNTAGGGGVGTGSPHPFTAFFDAVRLVTATDPQAVANGGFETPGEADGWIGGFGIAIVRSPVPAGLPAMDDGGSQYGLMGSPPSAICSSLPRCPSGDEIEQILRIPVVLQQRWFVVENLSLNLSMGNSCTPVAACTFKSGDFSSVTIGILDLSSGTNATLMFGNGSVIHGWGTPFQSLNFNVTSLSGHLVELSILVNSGTYAPQQGGGRSADSAWFAIDAIRLTATGVRVMADSGQHADATLHLQRQYWVGGCNGVNSGVSTLAQGFENVSTESAGWAWWQGPNETQVGDDLLVNVTAGIDVTGVLRTCLTGDTVWLQFVARGDANATGYAKTPSTALQSCPPTSSCAYYDELQLMNLSVTYRYISGNTTPNASAELEPATYSTSTGGITVHNLTAANPESYGFFNQRQSETIVETVAFVALSILVTGGTAALGEIPLVFLAAIGAAQVIADSALQYYVFDPLFSDFDAGGNSCSVTATPGGPSTESRYCIADTPLTGGYILNQLGSMSAAYQVPIGETHSGNGGGIYEITVLTTATYCYYDGLSGSCQPSTYPQPTSAFTLEIDTAELGVG